MILGQYIPALASVPWVTLGDWPTPIVHLRGRLYAKCEGDSHPDYGGNKLRTLEAWFGHAVDRGARRLWAIGARGSNHAVATMIHARRIGLPTGAIVFPQPMSEWAHENYDALRAGGIPIVDLPTVAAVPFAALARARDGDMVMPPGGATPIGTFGALAAVFELASQIDAQLAPPPARIVLAAGSTCTTAGLIAGLALARRMGAWRHRVPIVHAVRVTPWPITSRFVIAELARRTLARVAKLGGPAAGALPEFVVDGGEIGGGYGRMTLEGRASLNGLAGPRLDGVYSAKAAAALLRLERQGVGPLLFWASKSTTMLTA